MKNSTLLTCVLSIAFLVSIYNMGASAVYGGGVCTFPAAAPGGTTKCTATANGFCALDTIDFDKKQTAGICVCYPGYSGTDCATKDPATSPSSSSSSGSGGSSSGARNAIGAVALGSLAALALSQMGNGFGGLGGNSYGGNSGLLYPKERLYLQQATAY